MPTSKEDAKILLRYKEGQLSEKEKEELKKAASQSSYELLKGN